LKVKCIVNLSDITHLSPSTDIFPDCRFANQLKRLLVYRLRIILFRLKGELDKVSLAIQELKREEKEVLGMIRSSEVKGNIRKHRALDGYFMS
jgi:hypothetical protein